VAAAEVGGQANTDHAHDGEGDEANMRSSRFALRIQARPLLPGIRGANNAAAGSRLRCAIGSSNPIGSEMLEA
jgi:hypothetical protein